MIKLKSLLLSALMAVCMSVGIPAQAAPSPEPQTKITDIKQKKAVIEIVNQNLPQKVAEGMTFTKAEISTSGKVLTFTFSVDPQKMGGVTVDAFKKELNAMTQKQIRALLGEEFVQMLQMMDCDGRIIMKYPDGTQSTINVPLT